MCAPVCVRLWLGSPLPGPLFRRWSPAMNDKVAVGEDDWGRLHPSVPTSRGGPVRAKLTIAGTEAFVGLGKPICGKGPF